MAGKGLAVVIDAAAGAMRLSVCSVLAPYEATIRQPSAVGCRVLYLGLHVDVHAPAAILKFVTCHNLRLGALQFSNNKF